MGYIESIEELVDFALKDKTSDNKVVKLGMISDEQAELIKTKTGFELVGYEHVIDKSSINHTLKQHGNDILEHQRGQIAVKPEDFKLVPRIISSENIIYAGKNRHGKDCLLYEAIMDDLFYYIEEIRTGRKQLALQTMYKRKPSRNNT